MIQSNPHSATPDMNCETPSNLTKLALLAAYIAFLSPAALAQIPPPEPPAPEKEVALTPRLEVTRLNGNQPIITGQMFLDIDASLTHDAENINGPSLVRVPDWVSAEDRADPTAVYYLYFAHHSDTYIRMAWAANIEGPYTLYNTHADASLDDGMPGRGVLDVVNKDTRIVFPNPKYKIGRTLASPDVVIDHANQQFILYFHVANTNATGYDSGYFNTGGQKTLVATSGTGLNGAALSGFRQLRELIGILANPATSGTCSGRCKSSDSRLGIDQFP